MRTLFFLFILVTVMGCAGNQSKEDNTPVVVNDSVMTANGYDVIELQKMKTGHITVTIDVNGKPCLFLVDTGGGGTLIDISKKDKYGLKTTGQGDYAAGIGSIRSLVRTSATLRINGKELKSDDLYLMDISYLNIEFKKTKGKQVEGVLGTDFLEKHKAVIDYPHSKLYLYVEE